MAFAEEVGTRDFFTNPAHSGTNSLLARPKDKRRYYAPNAELHEIIKVQVDTLDRFCRNHAIPKLNILKLDIQGGELLALQGAVELLARNAIDIIYIEVEFVPHYENQPLFHQIVGFLSGYGYSLYNLYDLVYARNGQLRFGDAIFLSNPVRQDIVDAFPSER